MLGVSRFAQPRFGQGPALGSEPPPVTFPLAIGPKIAQGGQTAEQIAAGGLILLRTINAAAPGLTLPSIVSSDVFEDFQTAQSSTDFKPQWSMDYASSVATPIFDISIDAAQEIGAAYDRRRLRMGRTDTSPASDAIGFQWLNTAATWPASGWTKTSTSLVYRFAIDEAPSSVAFKGGPALMISGTQAGATARAVVGMFEYHPFFGSNQITLSIVGLFPGFINTFASTTIAADINMVTKNEIRLEIDMTANEVSLWFRNGFNEIVKLLTVDLFAAGIIPGFPPGRPGWAFYRQSGRSLYHFDNFIYHLG